MYRSLLALSLIMAPAVASAAGEVSVSSEAFLEQTVALPGGKTKTVLSPFKTAAPGSHVLYVTTCRNGGKVPVTNLVAVNPVSRDIRYDGSPDATAMVSVDGGKTYGALATLRVPAAAGATRPARPEDVTHVRWVVKTLPAGGSTKVSFKGTVK